MMMVMVMMVVMVTVMMTVMVGMMVVMMFMGAFIEAIFRVFKYRNVTIFYSQIIKSLALRTMMMLSTVMIQWMVWIVQVGQQTFTCPKFQKRGTHFYYQI